LSAYDTAKSRAADTYESVADRATQATSQMGNTVAGLGQQTAGATRDLIQFSKSQPLVLAGIGMAVGAIIGALIPVTETEASDQLKDQTRDAAETQYERAKEAVGSAVDQAETKASDAVSPEHPETSLVPEVEHSGSKQPAEI
jgi:ElaB/YqjD/DUF883 family membrane-anchored ribosome-binding protein